MISAVSELREQIQKSLPVLATSREVFIEQTMILALKMPEGQEDKGKRLLRPELSNLAEKLDTVGPNRIQPLLYKAASDFMG